MTIERLRALADECDGLEGLGSGVIAQRIRAILATASEARDAGQFYAACERACAELPAGWEIRVCLEKDAGTVELCSPDGFSEYMDVDADDRLTAEVNAAVDAAMRQEAGDE